MHHSTPGSRAMKKKKRFGVSGIVFRGSGFGLRFVREYHGGGPCDLRVQDFGYRVSDFRRQVPGFGFRVSSFGYRVQDFEFRVSSSEYRVSGFGLRVSGSGFRVSGIWFRACPTVDCTFGRGRGWGDPGAAAPQRLKWIMFPYGISV